MPDDQDDTKLPPPSGDSQRAEGYINQLTPLISQSKLRVTHTDLSKFDPSSLHDHYSLDLNEYQIEISHTKQPTTGRDSYVLLFNNLKNITADHTEKEILAYLIISEEQFKKLKDVAEEQIETLKKVEEEKRFKEAMTPVDKLIDEIAKGEVDLSKEAQPVPDLPTKENNDSAETLPIKEEDIKEHEQQAETVADVPAGASLTSDLSPETLVKEVAKADDNAKGVEDDQDTKYQRQEKDLFAEDAAKVSADTTPPLPHETVSTTIPAIEERPEAPVEKSTSADSVLAAEKPPPTISALAAAAALPLPEKAPSPEPTPGSAPVPISTTAPIANPSVAPIVEEAAEIHQGATPPPAPTMTIEEVQQALQKAYAQSPQQPPPPEYRSSLEQVSNQPAPVLGSTINTMADGANQPANPQIDQAIDQAFRPANNSVLSQASKTPEV